jgi:hypothetical protein
MCPEGISFLLEVQTEPGDCRKCPDVEAKCLGGSHIGPQPGFWRKSNSSSNFIACPNSAACLGILAPDYNPIGECYEYY